MVGSLIGTATGAIVGAGASRLAVGAIGAGRAVASPGVASVARPAAASQYSLPMSVGVPSGRGNSQLNLPMSVPQPANGHA
jgi:hypothetical protein